MGAIERFSNGTSAGRVARMATAGALAAFLAVAASCGSAIALDPPRPISQATVFPRHGVARIDVEATGAGRVTYDWGGVMRGEAEVVDGRASVVVDAEAIAGGSYVLALTALRGGERSPTAMLDVEIGAPRDADRFPVRWWGQLDARDDEAWDAMGVTGSFLDAITDAPATERRTEIRSRLDAAVRRDHELGLYLSPTLAPRWRGGTSLDVYDPAVRAHALDVARAALSIAGDHPGLRHVLVNEEIEPRFHDGPALRAAAEAARIDISSAIVRRLIIGDFVWRPVGPREVVDGAVPDDAPRARFARFWYGGNGGVAGVNAGMAGVLRAARPDVAVWSEPWRLAAVRTGVGLDRIATWTYGYPDIKRLYYVRYLQALARGTGLEVQQTITLLQYARMVAPTTGSRADLSRDKDGGDPFFIAGPDYATQAAWLVFAQRPDAMGFYATDSRPVSDPAQASPKYAPETFAALGEVLTRLVRPYGPAIRAARPAPARVAVYASATAEWFGAASMGRVVGYDAEQTLPYAALLAMNHVPFDVLLDEDVAEGRLTRYDVIVLPRAAALPAVSREALTAAVARGARLIANAPFPAPAPGTIVTAMTFDHEVQVDGALPVSERLGADAARRIDAAQATRLAPLFDRSVKQAEADTPRALVESLAAGRAMIHVVVNDHRDFGPRFGAHRLHLERGLPLRTRVSLRLDDRTAVYDALARRRLVVAPESAGWGAVGLELAAAQGALLFALPRPIGGVGLDTPDAGRRGTAVDVVIVVRDADGATIEADLPIEIEVTDPSGRRNAWSRFSTTRSADAGRVRFRFTPAFNEPAGRWTVKVTDLVAGTTATRGIAIAE